MRKEEYLSYIKNAVLYGRETYEQNTKKWLESFDPRGFFGYTPPGHIPVQAFLEGFMYKLTGDIEHAEWAKKGLLEMEEFKKYFPMDASVQREDYREALPITEPLFAFQPYISAYLYIKDSGVLSKQEEQSIRKSIKETVEVILHFPEWGAHNRSMLRVWGISLACAALGESVETKEWLKLCECLASETIGRWSIEDTELYVPLWLFATMEYVKIMNREEEYYRMPQTKYYFDFITNLITPNGLIPDFGDANFNSNWYIWLACLEKGASVYKCGHMKYAAQKIYEFGMSTHEKGIYSLGLAMYFVYAYMYADDGIIPKKPTGGSNELLEDLVGKKIVFRNGWEEGSTYMLFNYRDEGYYAYIPRKYLRTTIDVKAEKMHHGHSDENSVVMLTKAGNILLCDGGYRENLPNGKYRADIYHNRMVFREGIKANHIPVLEFLHDDGSYKKVFTEKIHFQRFSQLEMSRTRMYYLPLDIVWDRSIVYVLKEDMFIIIDWVKFNKEGNYMCANLWHSQIINGIYGNCYDVYYKDIHRYPNDAQPYQNKTDYSLLVQFPLEGKNIGHEPIKRCYGDNIVIYEYSNGHYKAGQSECFVTVLCPKRRDKNEIRWKRKVKVEALGEDKDYICVSAVADKDELYITVKLDLDKGLLSDEFCPQYTWESGKIEYGLITTDADFSYVWVDDTEKSVKYGLIDGSGLAFKHKSLFFTPKFSSYQLRAKKLITADHKWKAWEGETEF